MMIMNKQLETKITMTPGICGGRPCVAKTRIRVIDVLGLLAAGASREEILVDYPSLKDENITACLEFAQNIVAGIFPE